ncbi:MAG: hypothetical protein WC390_06700 [Sulfurimonas sp.]|jgi:hypothetical protein
MSVYLGQLYHWSPKENRIDILKNGLQIMSKSSSDYVPLPWICLGTTPSTAWSYTLAEQREIETWDLWQVSLQEHDHMVIRSDLGPYIQEVRIHNGLPADRIWWIGERDCHAGVALQKLNVN